ncbi:MAG: alanine/ornithine racemase family PLP-dependent enzyme, partial [Candidatus Thermoplasmatota archaeon]|nr:alanine/ornithine racemase family PLP-dependent enzyme [Candidatus Thermoplasmatota archaeon]
KDMVDLATLTMEVEGIRLEGVGTNLACYCGVIPTSEKMMELSRMVHKLEDSLGVRMRMVSGGNSANIPLLLDEGHPPEINHLRIGEAIMLGVETVNREPIPGMHQDAFRIHGEVVESKDKPSTPNGEISQDAFGNTPVVEDRGIIHEALIALGRQDVLPSSLEPEMSGLEILGANSDFIIVDPGEEKMKIGDTLTFIPGYGSLLQAMTSPYVEKKYENGHRGHPRKRMDVNA